MICQSRQGTWEGKNDNNNSYYYYLVFIYNANRLIFNKSKFSLYIVLHLGGRGAKTKLLLDLLHVACTSSISAMINKYKSTWTMRFSNFIQFSKLVLINAFQIPIPIF